MRGVLHLAVDVVPLRHSALLPDQRRTNPTQGPSVSHDVLHSTRRGIFQTSLTGPTVFHSLSMHKTSRPRNQTPLKHFRDAMKLADADLWRVAAENEIMSLQNLNVYSLVPRSTVPPGKKVYSTKWVFKMKPNKTYKACLVAQGWNLVPGQDCGSTFAPVCRLQSIRMVLAIAAEMDWEVRQLGFPVR